MFSGKKERVLDIDPEIPVCRFNLGLPKQNLNRLDTSGALEDQSRLGSPSRVCPAVPSRQSGRSDPFAGQAFDTTQPMGLLTLYVLLSFAQF